MNKNPRLFFSTTRTLNSAETQNPQNTANNSESLEYYKITQNTGDYCYIKNEHPKKIFFIFERTIRRLSVVTF